MKLALVSFPAHHNYLHNSAVSREPRYGIGTPSRNHRLDLRILYQKRVHTLPASSLSTPNPCSGPAESGR